MYNLYQGFYILAQFKHSNKLQNSLEYSKKARGNHEAYNTTWA